MKNKTFILLMILGIFFSACTKDDEGNLNDNMNDNKDVELMIEDSPSADADDDNKSSGVYKGTFVGSSGYFKLVIDKSEISATIIVDSVGYSLTTEEISESDFGSEITNALFTEPTGKVEIKFSVKADGSEPAVEIDIVGHTDVVASVSKENSDFQVKVFEGYRIDTYPDDGQQCKNSLNVVLGKDNTAQVTWKYNETIELDDGVDSDRTCDYEAWTSEYTYSINGSKIDIYTEVYEIPGDPSTMLLESLFESDGGMDISTIDGKEVYSASESWYSEENSYTYTEEIKLVRVL